MINWIPRKEIDHENIQELLKPSLEKNQFTNYGPNVQLLEKEIKQMFEVEDHKSVIAVSNGSVAIHILSAALEIYHKKPISWATQSFTFPPSAQMGLKNASIVDIDNDGGIDLDKLEDYIKPTADVGIVVTNVFGNLVNIDKYESWAKAENRFLIFDNAATSYTFYKNRNCINYGVGSTISFHHTKPFGFGEGGAIIVDKQYEDAVRSLTNFGIGYSSEYFLREGTNGKMSDVSAVYILSHLYHNFEKIVTIHSQLYNYTCEKIKKYEGVKLFPSYHDKDSKIVPSCLTFVFDKYDKKYETKLLNNHIFCRKYYYPLKKTEVSEQLFNSILCVPCTTEMTTDCIDTIFELLFDEN